MSETTSHSEIKMGSERSFGWVFCAIFIIVSGVYYYKNGTLLVWPLIVAGAFALVTIFAPAILKPFNTLWFKFGMLLGAIIAPLVMMIIFFLVVTPIGLLMRLFGKDSLRLKRDPKLTTYWITRSKEDDELSSMKNQF